MHRRLLEALEAFVEWEKGRLWHPLNVVGRSRFAAGVVTGEGSRI
jgi:hypothetical protein